MRLSGGQGVGLSAIAVLAGAAGIGLFISRVIPATFYTSQPELLNGSVEFLLAVSAAVIVIALWLGLGLMRSKRSFFLANSLLPFAGLVVVLTRPFPDLYWSALVLVAACAGGLLAAARAWPHGTVGGLFRASIKPRGDGSAEDGPGRVATGAARSRALARQLGPCLAAAVSFLVYLRTMAPSVVAGDSAELQTAGYTLGIAHPTGYPLYLLIAKGFTFLPFGNAAYRVNLLSGVCAALAVYFLVLTAQTLTRDTRAAMITGLTFAFGQVFWSQSVIAEKYALNVLFVLLLIYLLLKGLAATSPRSRRGLSPYALWLTFGLSLTHHRTALMLGPAILAFVLMGRWRALTNAKALLAATALGVLPLTAYLYLPLRWPAVYGKAIDWAQFSWHVSGSDYMFLLRPQAIWEEPGRYEFFLQLVSAQMTLPGIVLGALGIAALLFRQPRAALLTLLSFVAVTLFAVSYHVPNAEVYFLPSFAIFALWLANGISVVLKQVGRLQVSLIPLPGSAELVVTLSALVPAFLLLTNYAPNDASGNWTLDRWGHSALEQQVPPGATVIADMPRMSALRYLYGVEAPERDVTVLMPDTEDNANELIAARLGAGRPVYLARYLPGLETKYRLNSPGPLIEVSSGAPALSSPRVPRNDELPSGLTMAGFTPGPKDVAAGQTWHTTLYWRLAQKIAESYSVYLRLVDEGGEVVFTAKPVVPVQGLYPTWAWPARELIADYQDLPLPISLAPGRYQVYAGMGGQFQAPAQWTALESLRVLPPAEAAATRPILAIFGGQLALVGYEWTGTAQPGGHLVVTLRWQALALPSAAGLSTRLELTDGVGLVVASKTKALRSPDGSSVAQPTWIERDELALAAGIPPQSYQLRVYMESPNAGALAVVSGWPGVTGEAATLASVTVNPAPGEALANMENKIILVRADVATSDLRPGDVLHLGLRWQAAARLDRDYTVFVHLLDAAQRVKAQADSFPVGGLQPTTRWRVGDEVADEYEIRLPAHLKAGEYRLEVGMYLAANMQRLLVVNADGQPVDDRVLVGSIRVSAE